MVGYSFEIIQSVDPCQDPQSILWDSEHAMRPLVWQARNLPVAIVAAARDVLESGIDRWDEFYMVNASDVFS